MRSSGHLPTELQKPADAAAWLIPRRPMHVAPWRVPNDRFRHFPPPPKYPPKRHFNGFTRSSLAIVLVFVHRNGLRHFGHHPDEGGYDLTIRLGALHDMTQIELTRGELGYARNNERHRMALHRAR